MTEHSPNPEPVEHEHAADQLDRFRDELSRTQLDNDRSVREQQIDELTEQCNSLALSLFPTELGHFTIKGQTTISSKYKDAEFEQKRTLSSMFATLVLAPKDEQDLEVNQDDPRYQLFVHHQRHNPDQGSPRLSLSKFNELRTQVFHACKNKYDLLTLNTILSMHDTTKLATVARTIEKTVGIKSINHDLLLSYMVEFPTLVDTLAPSLNRLPDEAKELAIQVMNLNFNRSQFTQAEATPAHLVFVDPTQADEQVVQFQRIENICDLAGVIGNVGGVINEEVFLHYQFADNQVDMMRAGKLSTKQAYLGILQLRADMMGMDEQFEEDDFDTFEGKEKITLMRFACLLRMSKLEDYNMFKAAYDNLGPDLKENLVEMFGRSGLDGKLGVLFYYAPALMVEVREAEEELDPENGTLFGIEKGLRLISSVAIETQKHLQEIDLETAPIYTQKDSKQPIEFDDIAEIRGPIRDKNGQIIEFVVALTKIVKDNERKIIVLPFEEGEAEAHLKHPEEIKRLKQK